MKTLLPKYQYLVWIACSLIIVSFAAIPHLTLTENPRLPSSTGHTAMVLAGMGMINAPSRSESIPSDDYAIIGAPDEDYDMDGTAYMSNAGCAYIYDQDIEGDWNRKQKINASDRETKDLFGWSAAIFGNYAVISAPHEDHDAQGGSQVENSGSAYIFEKDNSGEWIEKQKIVASDRKPYDQFGISVSIFENFLIVGAHEADKDHHSGKAKHNAGAAYIFEKDDSGKWIEVQKIVAADHKKGDGFGYRVSIIDNLAVVGTRNQDINVNSGKGLSGAGAAYIFERSREGHWMQTQKIASPRQTFLALEKMF